MGADFGVCRVVGLAEAPAQHKGGLRDMVRITWTHQINTLVWRTITPVPSNPEGLRVQGLLDLTNQGNAWVQGQA
jgi:hypothetical protein